MKCIRKVLALMLAVVLLPMVMSAAPAAKADTSIKSVHGAFAAESELLEKLFMILPVETGAALYKMPAAGGTVTLVESAPQINDLIAGENGEVYYLRYNGSVFQAVKRDVDGNAVELAQFQTGQLAYSLSLYNGSLYCLVDNKLTRIALDESGEVTTVSGNQMVSYIISNNVIYYQSADDEVSYEKDYARADGTQLKVTTASGKLYAMNLDGTYNMQQFDQGVSNMAAYGEYIYFHNYNDSYVVDGNPDAWLDGKLYRLNVQTNQAKLLRNGYDWNYRPVDLGLVVYQLNSLSVSAQDGTNPVELYAPDPYNYLALLDDCAIVYEYNLQKLTRVPYDNSGAVLLWEGPFVTDGTQGDVITSDGTGNTGTTTDNNTTGNTGTTGTTGNTGTTGTTGTTGNTGTTGTTGTTGNTGTTGTTGSTGNTTGVTANGSLTYGATGERVREVQERLKELGYLSSADGVFGTKTLNAVKAFQKAAGLTADGVVGAATLKKLNSSSAPEYAGDSSYIFPNSNTKKLTRAEILAVNKSLWPYARNEIYARHGYSFTNSKYEKYFEGKSWYKAGGFSTSDLNSIEWYNMQLLLEMEEEYSEDSADVDYQSEYIFPESNTRKLTKAEIREVDSELWPYARNEIYARHGYKFTKAKFKNYFESKSWYKAGGFSTKKLSDIEWYNMELIRWMEENEG